MFCPKCRCAYIEGVTICDDCGCGLVNTLPPADADELLAKYMASEWVFLKSAESASELVVVKALLESCGIPIRTQKDDIGERIKTLYGFSPGASDVYVPKDLLEKAKGILDAAP